MKLKWISLEAKKKNRVASTCLITHTQKAYIKVNTNNRKPQIYHKTTCRYTTRISYFSFHPANFQTSKSDKWHLSLSHFIDFKELPIRYTPTNMFQATQPTSHHILPQPAVTRTINQPNVTTPKLECDGGNFASESIASSKTYILWRFSLITNQTH